MDDRSPAKSDALPEDLARIVNSELETGERLIWASRAQLPPLPLRFGPLVKGGLTALTLLLSCLLGLGALSLVCLPRFPGWEPDPDKEVAFLLIALFILATGLTGTATALGCILLGLSRFMNVGQLRRRVYALTDQRAIIWSPETGSTPTSLHRGSILPGYVKLVCWPFGYESVLIRRIDRNPCGFLGVADARRVEGLVRRYLLVERAKASQ